MCFSCHAHRFSSVFDFICTNFLWTRPNIYRVETWFGWPSSWLKDIAQPTKLMCRARIESKFGPKPGQPACANPAIDDTVQVVIFHIPLCSRTFLCCLLARSSFRRFEKGQISLASAHSYVLVVFVWARQKKSVQLIQTDHWVWSI